MIISIPCFKRSLDINGRRGGLMASALDSGSGEPWPGRCVVILGKTLYSHSASLHPGV